MADMAPTAVKYQPTGNAAPALAGSTTQKASALRAHPGYWFCRIPGLSPPFRPTIFQPQVTKAFPTATYLVSKPRFPSQSLLPRSCAALCGLRVAWRPGSVGVTRMKTRTYPCFVCRYGAHTPANEIPTAHRPPPSATGTAAVRRVVDLDGFISWATTLKVVSHREEIKSRESVHLRAR